MSVGWGVYPRETTTSNRRIDRKKIKELPVGGWKTPKTNSKLSYRGQLRYVHRYNLRDNPR